MVKPQRLIEDFTLFASTSSPSFSEGAFAELLRERLETMGAQVLFDDSAQRTGSDTGNLIARFVGTIPDAAPFLLSAHLDVVSPAKGVIPLLEDGVFRSAGATVLGADDKSGIVEILEALRILKEQGIPHGPIELVLTVCEEVGLLGAKELDFSLIRARRGLALDTTGVDILIHRAPAANRMRFRVLGREAHAGIAPETGISAIEVAARAIAPMRLGRIDEETTANLGTIAGGLAGNIVPRELWVEGEVRSHNPEKLSAQTAHMCECFEEAARQSEKIIDGMPVRAEIEMELNSDYPAMHVPLDSPLVSLVQQAASSIGRPLSVRAGGGGSDANIFNARGIETLILATGMSRVHSVDESVSVADMEAVSRHLVEILSRAWS